ncbi:hypothetical protein TVAG_055440 [Trichomonas vaginalis G3]|uniref:Uncharacterized protein n=1 Tax=Trichomonas vaginalis (strain ATCC PRA-98 / G3) TaxID=412133 RepID=A2H0J5_TRIV3|nr:hypothetical protein TVAG_055440 [Trichomonas vaginalis G3]|eukprot:XP_001290002.1 hypothetical protein [Trichomonas vaginalis G3]
MCVEQSFEAATPGWQHPAPLRTWKLSSRGPHQYWAGRLPGNVRCLLLFPFCAVQGYCPAPILHSTPMFVPAKTLV